MRGSVSSSSVWLLFLVSLSLTILHAGCKSDSGLSYDEMEEVKGIFPNPAKLGDTVSIGYLEVSFPTQIDSLTQVSIMLRPTSEQRFIYPATGVLNVPNGSVVGSLAGSKALDTLIALGSSTVVQFRADSTMPPISVPSVSVKGHEIRSTLTFAITH